MSLLKFTIQITCNKSFVITGHCLYVTFSQNATFTSRLFNVLTYRSTLSYVYVIIENDDDNDNNDDDDDDYDDDDDDYYYYYYYYYYHHHHH